jgi:hypothetical protein
VLEGPSEVALPSYELTHSSSVYLPATVSTCTLVDFDLPGLALDKNKKPRHLELGTTASCSVKHNRSRPKRKVGPCDGIRHRGAQAGLRQGSFVRWSSVCFLFLLS